MNTALYFLAFKTCLSLIQAIFLYNLYLSLGSPDSFFIMYVRNIDECMPDYKNYSSLVNIYSNIQDLLDGIESLCGKSSIIDYSSIDVVELSKNQKCLQGQYASSIQGVLN